MFNQLNGLQIASVCLMASAVSLIITTLIYMAFKSINGIKSRLDIAEKAIKENGVLLNRVSQQLNNYQS